MKIFVSVFCFDRPDMLRHSLATIMGNAVQHDCEVLAANDGWNPEVARVLRLTQSQAHSSFSIPFNVLQKSRSVGMVHSGKIALGWARTFMPQYWFIAESDYIFRMNCYETVLDVFENTEQGKMALGIVGYDAANAYDDYHRSQIFPTCMKMQVGEDNVKRDALYKSEWFPGAEGRFVELACSTASTCYLNWRRICAISEEFPELTYLLDQAFDPRDNPDYPQSGYFRQLQMVDDGMLSHAINLVWNRWALKHGIDRDKFGAWLNIKPSVAQAVTGGGIHSGSTELNTNTLSPTWNNDDGAIFNRV